MALRKTLAVLALLALLACPATLSHAQTTHATSPAAVLVLKPLFFSWIRCNGALDRANLYVGDIVAAVGVDAPDSSTIQGMHSATTQADRYCGSARAFVRHVHVHGSLAHNKSMVKAVKALNTIFDYKREAVVYAHLILDCAQEWSNCYYKDLGYYQGRFSSYSSTYQYATRFWYYLNHTA
jgi:hypothetical protein